MPCEKGAYGSKKMRPSKETKAKVEKKMPKGLKGLVGFIMSNKRPKMRKSTKSM